MYEQISRIAEERVVTADDFRPLVGRSNWGVFDFTDGEAVAKVVIYTVTVDDLVGTIVNDEETIRVFDPDELAIRIEAA